MNENMIYTKGIIDENGNIFVPCVYLEAGTEVDHAIKVVAGKFEIAMFPSDTEKDCDDICEGECEKCPFNDEGM